MAIGHIAHTPDRRGGVAWLNGSGECVAGAARGAGLAPPRIKRRLRAGRLHRVHRGVYARRAHRAAPRGAPAGGGAGLRARRGARHRSAAAHWGLLRTDQTRIDVTAPAGATAPRGSACTALAPSMPRTPPTMKASRSRRSTARCSTWPPPRGRASSSGRWPRQSAFGSTTTARSQTSSPEPTGTAEPGSSPRPPAASPRTRNEWEAEFLKLHPPAPASPSRDATSAFHVPDHGPCKPDFHWPEHHVIVETDGFETHGTRAAFEDDRAKDAALTAAGYSVLRFTRDEDATILTRLRAAARADAARASPGSSCPPRRSRSSRAPCRGP